MWRPLLGPCSLRVLGPLVCPHTSGQAPPWTVASVTVISVDRSLRGPRPLCTTSSVGCPLRDCGLSGLWTVASVVCGPWPLWTVPSVDCDSVVGVRTSGRRKPLKWEAEARSWPLCMLCADGLGAWPGRGWKWWGFEWGDSAVAALGVGRGEPRGLGGAGVSCPCPGAPALGSLLACSHPEATGTCGQSPRGRMGPTVPRRRSVHSGKSTFRSQRSLGRTTGHGTQHTISGHGPWGIQSMEPSTSAGLWL